MSDEKYIPPLERIKDLESRVVALESSNAELREAVDALVKYINRLDETLAAEITKRGVSSLFGFPW